MTVSVTHATQGTTVVTTKPCTAFAATPPPTCRSTTRSAAMMALALGQRTKSPALTCGNKNRTSKTINGDGTSISNFSSASATTTMSAASTIFTKSKNSSAAGAPPKNCSVVVASVAPLKHTAQINGTAGTLSGGSASSGSDNDGFNTSSSSSATALRRLYFKSGRSAKSKINTTATTSMTSIPLSAVSTAAVAYHTSMGGGSAGLPAISSASNTANGGGVPKVFIMGSSTASMTDANINTSTDSASTLVTSVTHTDTSETCDSLDLGDNSYQSEPLFSSLEEPLLTAIQMDSEHDGTEMELTSCTMYPRPDINLQDSTESQESSLSILTVEPSSTTPLLASHRRHNGSAKTTATTTTTSGTSDRVVLDKEHLPKTAPAPTSATKHFTFDPPNSPKSARTSEKSRSHFTFKDTTSSHQQKQQQSQQKQPVKQARRNFDTPENRNSSNWEERIYTTNFIEEQQQQQRSTSATRRDHSPNKGKYRAYVEAQRNSYYAQEQEDSDLDDSTRSKKSRARDSSANTRNRYSTGGGGGAITSKTSPKREPRRSPTRSSKVNSAPPTMKDGNFFGSGGVANKPKQLSPSSQQHANQRKYSSSSSSGGSERIERERAERTKDATMFPFDREAIDYERIQRECFAVNENSSSATGGSSDSDEPEPCSVYERKLSAHLGGSPKSSADIFQQYTLLTQQQQQQQGVGGSVNAGGGGGPPSRKNSKRIRPDSVMHTTIRENQQYVPPSDAFYPKTSSSSGGSPGELNKFDEIASKFDQIPPKHGGSNANLSLKAVSPTNSVLGNNGGGGGGGSGYSSRNSPTGSMRGGATSPSLRVDYFTESSVQQMHPRKKSFKHEKTGIGSGGMTGGGENFDECQRGATSSAAGSINVTPNPLEAAVCTQPRATIVVQQPSLSLDNTVETLLIKNEGDFISVEQGKDQTGAALARKRNSQQLQHPPHHSHQTQQQQKRDENMRQLLDVTNTLTFEELRDFEMRYGSPHHSRSQSVKTPGSRASGRPNQLCLPQQRSRVASMPNTGVEEEYYRLRHFSITGKGIVNRGDSLKSRRSRSNNSVASSNSSTEHLTATHIPAPSSARTSATCSLASSRESSTSNPGSGPYRVLMLGGSAVGKSSLVSQFMTSEYLHAYDTSIDDDSGEKAVSVLLSGEESELIFIDHAYTEMTPDDCLTGYDPHGYCVIYSASDRSSFTVAEHVLQVLWTNQNIAQKAVILVANKADLARSRLVTSEEGKAMATAYDCKFIETSVGINHNVDELLVGLLSQIRLKLENPEKSRDLFRKRSIRKSKRRACSPLGGAACLTGGTHPNTPLGPANTVISDANTPPGSAQSSPRKYRGSRTSTSLKVKGLLGRVWARDSKSKSCENLHVL